MDEPIGTLLPLSEAMLTWCAPQLVEEIKKYERRCSRNELMSWKWPRLVPDGELRQPTGNDWMAGGSSSTPALRDAWANLENECRRLMRAGELYLTGVPVNPELTTETQLIPAAWASELKFDLIADAIVLPGRKFANVLVSKRPPVAAVTGPSRPGGRLPEITTENLRDLTDDEVMLLLMDHAERVRSNDGMLIPPGKVTVMPIIRSKMRDRSTRGDLLPTLTAECQWLSEWIEKKLGDNYATPKANTIGKMLGTEYALLKPRSNAATQISKA